MPDVRSRIKNQFKEKPIVSAALIIGMIAGLVTIATFSGTVVTAIGERFVVSPSQLIASEKRIVSQFHQESVLIRNVLIAEVEARKKAIEKLLEDAEKVGQIELYKIEIAGLNKKMDALRGKK